MSQQLPDPQTVDSLLNLFERVRSPRPDPDEAAHRRGLESAVLRLTGAAVIALLAVCSWVAVDPQGRYQPEQRQQGMQALGAAVAGLVGAVAGYSVKGR